MPPIVEPPEPPKCKSADNLRPPCFACGKPWALIEPDAPSHDLRIYYYAGCASNEPLLPLSRRERIA